MRVRKAAQIVLAGALLATAAVTLTAQTPAPAAPAPMKKMAPPLRGLAEVGYMVSAKNNGKTIVTTFEVKNLSTTGSIIGLQITQDWYDKSGSPMQGTGDRQRLRTPLGPGEVATIVLTSPVVSGMGQPQHSFVHQNGKVTPKLLKTMK